MGWINAELALTALAAMLSPTTLTFSVLVLVLGARPLRTGLWFYAGALVATLGIGVVAAFVLGNAAAAFIGLGLAGVATKLFEALERSIPLPQHLEVSWVPPPWLWSAFAGILIVQASYTPALILGTSLRILHGGQLGCSTSTLVAIAVTDFAGFAACGYIAGRVTPSRATLAVALGLIVLFIVTITDITGFSEERIITFTKCLGQIGDAEDVYSFKFGAIAGLIPRAFLSLYAAALGGKHQHHGRTDPS